MKEQQNCDILQLEQGTMDGVHKSGDLYKVNIDIDIATHYVDENDVHIDIKQLEDDRNSSTGNV